MSGENTLEMAGRRLREERERTGISLDNAALTLGLSDRSQLWRIEHGERGLGSIVLRRAATLYGVPMDAFFAEDQRAGVVVKARRGDADDHAATAMAEWTQRKLAEWRFVKREVVERDL